MICTNEIVIIMTFLWSKIKSSSDRDFTLSHKKTWFVSLIVDDSILFFASYIEDADSLNISLEWSKDDDRFSTKEIDAKLYSCEIDVDKN